MLRLLWLFCLATAVACDGEGHVVPFGQETPEQPVEESPPDEVAPSAISRTLGGETAIELEGASFSAEGAKLHALYADDVDGDGDRDALVLGSRYVEPATDLLLVFGRREGSHIVTRVLASQRVPDCQASDIEASFRGADGLQRVASASFRCGEQPVDVRFVITAEPTPRTRERIAVRGGEIAISFPDIDEDEHLDLRAELTLFGHTTTLEWLDRAGGLAPVSGEPEGTLSAIRGQDNAHEIARALCGPEANVAVGGHWGLDCPSASTQGIRLDAAIARANEDLPRALHELGSLSVEERGEFFERLELPTVSWRRLPHVLPAAGATRHAALSFADDDTLIDHTTNMTIPLQTGSSRPQMAPAPIQAPGGEAAAVRSVSARGSTFAINIGSDAPFHSPTGRTLSLPSAPASEWLVLGWAPQGLLLFDGVERFLATLGEDSTQLTLRVVAQGALLPAPFSGARTDPSGGVWAAETTYGVLMGDGDELALWRPRDWDDDVENLALALSPSGNRVALAREDGVFLMTAGAPREASTAINAPMETTSAPSESPPGAGNDGDGDLQAP